MNPSITVDAWVLMNKSQLQNNDVSMMREITLCELEKIHDNPALKLHLKLANSCMKTSTAMLSIVDATHQRSVLSTDLNQLSTEKHLSFCYHSINSGQSVFVLGDTSLDPTFRNSPLVKQPNGIRFYASALLEGPNNGVFGTLCVTDTKFPHRPSEQQLLQLRWLGDLVSLELKNIDFDSKSPITGLYTFDKLNRIGQLEFDISRENHTKLLLCLLNVNNFRLINQSLGISSGNLFLHECADILKSIVHPDDLLFHLSPDRFAILMTITNDMQGIDIAQTLQLKLSHFHIHNAPSEYKLFPVIGLGFSNSHDQSFQDVLNRADNALSLAEAQGNGAMVELHDGHHEPSIGCTHRVGLW